LVIRASALRPYEDLSRRSQRFTKVWLGFRENLRALCVLCVRFQRDYTQGDPCATGHSPRSNPQRRRIDRPRSAIDRDQTTAGTNWEGPARPLPGLVRSNPHPAGPMRSRHLHLRRSLHGRSPRASVVVLHCGTKKEISTTQPRRRPWLAVALREGGSAKAGPPSRKIATTRRRK
jgi:hypothetical protein